MGFSVTVAAASNDTETSVALPHNAQNETTVTVSIRDDSTSHSLLCDVSSDRKRKSKPHPEDWKKNANKILRMREQAYIGYKKSQIGKIAHDTPREARKLGPTCTSKMCQKSIQRKCHQFSVDDRQAVFNTFWETMSWDQRKVYVINFVDVIPTKHPGKNISKYRRKGALIYHLKNKLGRHKVCKKMFLNTLGIKGWTVRYWLDNSTQGMSPETDSSRLRIRQTKKKGERTFVNSLPKLPSHYCRKSSSKLYLKPILQSKQQLHLHGKMSCREVFTIKSGYL
ncbi:uncharacterized protein LOC126237069 [Schistocerca nitens]|uniref:uncharacterized protein LOC126237069 n=1 Tax=Schistocerca nitens TaxID=7011 RepID=UPI002117CB55|nr:uncharacterized protein LOC126237069 [Schistocerca nitens]